MGCNILKLPLQNCSISHQTQCQNAKNIQVAYLYTNSQSPMHMFFEPGVSVQGRKHFVYHPCQKVHPIIMVWWQSAVLHKILLICYYNHMKLLKLSELSQNVECLLSMPWFYLVQLCNSYILKDRSYVIFKCKLLPNFYPDLSC